MANNINIAVKRTKLIESVKKAIQVREAQLKQAEEAQASNEKLRQSWLKEVQKNLGKPRNIIVHNSYDPRVEVTYSLPASVAEPKYLNVPSVSYQVKDELNSLKNGLTLLEMSDEEVIKTASYGSISKFL